MTTGTMLDHSLGYVLETTWNVPEAPTTWAEWKDSSGFDVDPNVVQGEGLQQGADFDRADRRVALVAKPSGKIEVDLLSLGLGPLLQAWAGSSTSANVSGTMYQQVHTFHTTAVSLDSFAVQEGIVNVDGTLDPQTWRGCHVKSGEIAVPASGLATLKLDVDARSAHMTRTVADGVTTNTSATLSSATAAFDFDDIGAPVSGTGIPASTTITAVATDGTSCTMSAAATADGTGLTITIGQAYATPSYGSGGSLFSNALPATGALVLGGTLTAPTTTALGSLSGGTTAVGMKSWTFTCDNGLDTDRDVIGGRNEAITGSRMASLETVMEYDATTGRLLKRALTRQTQYPIVLTAKTAEVLGADYAALQVVLPAAAIDSGAIPMPTRGKTTTQSIKWKVLKSGSSPAAYLVYRTSDTAI